MKCAPCNAAAASEAGKLVLAAAQTVPGRDGELIDGWHAWCEGLGSGCSCGCPYSTGELCPECGTPTDAVGKPCTDTKACAERVIAAFHAGITPPQARPLSHMRADVALVASARAEGRDLGVSAFRAPSRAGKRRPCACGCGETTGGGTYRPGHDARHVSALVASVRAGELTLEEAVDKVASDALKAKLTKAVEG